MQLKRLLFFGLLSLLVTSAFAQKGKIRGSVVDGATGESLLGATILVKNTTAGTTTDLDGKFELSVEAGTYELQVSFITYSTLTISAVVVKTNEVTLVDNIRLKEEVAELNEVVITANAIRETESALLTVKRKSANVMDGISSESFRRIGTTDAASAVTRVPGVSVQGGKYVFVRGLGDRYTKTTLNRMEIPGLDPDRNSIQLDIFPTSILNNIIVYKSFTADLPADFTGGIVDIEPNSFPEEKNFKVSFSLGYNPDMNLKSNYLTYEGGKLDFLGFDDGTRKQPFPSKGDTPPPVGDSPELTKLTRSFNPVFGTSEGSSLPNLNLSLSFGNQVVRGNSTIGYLGALSYLNTTTYMDDVQNNNIFFKSFDFSEKELDSARFQKGVEGNNNVIASALLGLAIKKKLSKYSVTAIRIQNGESTAGLYNQRNLIGNSNEAIRDVLGYSQRSLTSILLAGENRFSEASDWSVEWKLAPTFSTIEDKDIRVVPFRVSESGELSIEPSEVQNPARLWRNLNEYNYAGKLDVVRDFAIRGRNNKLRLGVAQTYKQRDFGVENFDFLVQNQEALEINGDPNRLLIDEHIYRNGTGTWVRASYQGSNTYESSINVLGGYVSAELAMTDRLKAIVGVRVENYVQRYTGGNQDYFNSEGAQGIFLDNEKVLESFKPFPTANLIYAYQDNTNLRLSYAKTIARPSFKEKSIAQIIDPVSSTTWIGNIDLEETDIHNLDLRWEKFFSQGQTIALSGFYKSFYRPIEVQVYSSAAPDNFTARNNGDAIVYGVELEARKTLDFIAPVLSRFSVNVNASLIQSRLQIGEVEKADRETNKRTDETVEDFRVMQGQSPYLVNAGLNYQSEDQAWEGGLFYNVQGKALAIVGVGNIPDIYTMPFNSVNASIKKSFGVERKASLQFRVANLLDDKIESRFQSFGAADRIQSIRQPGRTFTVAFGYTF